jgi:hypothetical protein
VKRVTDPLRGRSASRRNLEDIHLPYRDVGLVLRFRNNDQVAQDVIQSSGK